MKNLIYLLFTATLFLATACDKEDEMTTTSNSNNHDILRCKINGENWTPAGGGPDIISPITLEYYSDTRVLELIAFRSVSDERRTIRIFTNKLVTGVNEIKNSNYIFANELNSDDCVLYIKNSLYNNIINVELIDTVNYYMIGTFEFQAINECQDTIKVTEGYFDLNYTF